MNNEANNVEKTIDQPLQLSALLCVLADISSMCVGEIAMNYKLEAQAIGEMIYEATGMTQPELSDYARKRRA